MDLGGISITLLVASLMVAATPILLAALGELIVEKAGVLNLGRRGHDDHRCYLRLRHRGGNRITRARVCGRRPSAVQCCR